MINPAQLERFRQSLSVLHDAPAPLLRDFQESARLVHLPKGHDIFVEGDTVDSVALVVSGQVRVYKIGDTGREITLYRFGANEACMLTTSAILSYQTFPAIATVEHDTEAVMLPADALRRGIVEYEGWRRFVFGLLAQRLSAVMATVNEVAFKRMDVRIAAFILAHGQDAYSLRITHQQIAAELGSSREVVSRILENFAEDQLIRLERGSIEVIDAGGLRNRAAV